MIMSIPWIKREGYHPDSQGGQGSLLEKCDTSTFLISPLNLKKKPLNFGQCPLPGINVRPSLECLNCHLLATHKPPTVSLSSYKTTNTIISFSWLKIPLFSG